MNSWESTLGANSLRWYNKVFIDLIIYWLNSICSTGNIFTICTTTCAYNEHTIIRHDWSTMNKCQFGLIDVHLIQLLNNNRELLVQVLCYCNERSWIINLRWENRKYDFSQAVRVLLLVKHLKEIIIHLVINNKFKLPFFVNDEFHFFKNKISSPSPRVNSSSCVVKNLGDVVVNSSNVFKRIELSVLSFLCISTKMWSSTVDWLKFIVLHLDLLVILSIRWTFWTEFKS